MCSAITGRAIRPLPNKRSTRYGRVGLRLLCSFSRGWVSQQRWSPCVWPLPFSSSGESASHAYRTDRRGQVMQVQPEKLSIWDVVHAVDLAITIFITYVLTTPITHPSRTHPRTPV